MSEIEACRTCGIFFLSNSSFLRHLKSNDPEMLAVRQELEAWRVNVDEDRFPQYICTVCLLEFRKIFKFQSSCLETQVQLRQLYAIQQDNIKKMKIKTEIVDDMDGGGKIVPEYTAVNTEEEPNVCAFVYVDDLSDSDYDNGEENSHNVPLFKVPHIPIKEEIIEEARVPLEDDLKNDEEEEIDEETQQLLPPSDQTDKSMDIHHSPSLEEGQSTISAGGGGGGCVGIQCELCMHISNDQQEHRQHLLRIHESKPLSCHICGKEFKAGTTQMRLKYHLQWHRLNKHIKCPQCGFYCASRSILNEHTRAVHTKKPCTICGKRLLPKKMRLHMEEHQLEENGDGGDDGGGGGTVEQRSYCVTDFTHQNEEAHEDQHIQMVNSTTDFIEEQNFHSFEQEEEETLHDDSLMDSGAENSIYSMSYSSEEAEAETSSSYSMENENNDFENYSNDSYETSLQNEMSTVNLASTILEEMQFTCAECPASFPKVEQLIAHAEVHSQEKSQFCCNVCGKKFELKFSLNRHMKRHKNITL